MSEEKSDMGQTILEKWEELKVLIDSTDMDIVKCAAGNNAAGKRSRKGLRLIKKEAGDLVRLTNTFGHVLKEQRKLDKEEE